MACRDTKRAQDAREKLYRPLDKHIATYMQGTEDHGYVVAEKRMTGQERTGLW